MLGKEDVKGQDAASDFHDAEHDFYNRYLRLLLSYETIPDDILITFYSFSGFTHAYADLIEKMCSFKKINTLQAEDILKTVPPDSFAARQLVALIALDNPATTALDKLRHSIELKAKWTISELLQKMDVFELREAISIVEMSDLVGKHK